MEEHYPMLTQVLHEVDVRLRRERRQDACKGNMILDFGSEAEGSCYYTWLRGTSGHGDGNGENENGRFIAAGWGRTDSAGQGCVGDALAAARDQGDLL
jgi:hypothetical protein